MLLKELPCLSQARLWGDRCHVPRHDLGTGHSFETPVVGLHLHLLEQVLQAVAIHVDDLVVPVENKIDSAGSDPHALHGCGVGGPVPAHRSGLGQVGIAFAGQVVEDERKREHHQRTGPNRPNDEAESRRLDRRTTENGDECQGTARRVEAPQDEHRRCRQGSGRGSPEELL
nr:hypothetical protein [Microvirga pakistanensis]